MVVMGRTDHLTALTAVRCNEADCNRDYDLAQMERPVGLHLTGVNVLSMMYGP
jgi:hypothetical protein